MIRLATLLVFTAAFVQLTPALARDRGRGGFQGILLEKVKMAHAVSSFCSELPKGGITLEDIPARTIYDPAWDALFRRLKKQKVQVLKLETVMQLNVKKPEAIAKWKRRAERDFGVSVVGPKAVAGTSAAGEPVFASVNPPTAKETVDIAATRSSTLVHPFWGITRPRPPAAIIATVEGTSNLDLAAACEDVISQTEITYPELRKIVLSSLSGAGVARAEKELNAFERKWRDYRERGSPAHEDTPVDVPPDSEGL